MGRVALVTGGTRGIGEAVSIGLKDAGYNVVASYAGNDEAANKFKSETGTTSPVFSIPAGMSLTECVAAASGALST
jgi:NAD(P)-dependent dehydrogenase (short-subunit alcohol dehydrogenase family)